MKTLGWLKQLKRWHKFAIAGLAFVSCVGVAGYVIYGGGKHEGPGTVHPTKLPDAMVKDRLARQKSVTKSLLPGSIPKQILFGDLHVHSTFSADAFIISLPLTGGEGAHPPADACDFARYCSSLDFFAMTDHAEALTPRHWRETKESVRACNAVAGDPANPDLVAFVGFEWTQVGRTPEEHYGHKNVIFRDLEEAKLPTRPIAAGGLASRAFRGKIGISKLTLATIPIREFSRRQRYLDFNVFRKEVLAVKDCPDGVNVRELPEGCRETAETPRDLFDKLDQWGFDTLVIPHGTTWGFYTPPGYNYDKQLSSKQHDPAKQTLFEVYSGHGNSEEYKPWRAIVPGKDGTWSCPAPTDTFTPCCWRAGEIIRERCGDIPATECTKRVEDARYNYANAGVTGHQTVPGTTTKDWQGCGQCKDCFNPAFSYRPGGSAQYALARGHFDKNGSSHARFGFIASSDNHTSRPGTGYKEFARRKMTEAAGPRTKAWRDRLFGKPSKPTPESRKLSRKQIDDMAPFRVVHLERQSSFFMTGGLVAVHSSGRDRNAVWDGLKRREVYGTSGERTLLWFDLVNGPKGKHSMGADVPLSATPKFVVRAAGSFKQKPGCPDWTKNELPPKRLERICAGECYNPSNERHLITRIEVVRIRPQQSNNEPISPLIQDAWKTFTCKPDPNGCRVEFEDPEFTAGARDVIYYVRAIQEPTNAVNAANERCKGKDCKSMDPCFGDFQTAKSEDCLSSNEERAWSSPIYVRHRAEVKP